MEANFFQILCNMTEVMYFQTAGYTGFDEQPTDLVPNGDGFYTLCKSIAIDYPIRSDCRELGQMT